MGVQSKLLHVDEGTLIKSLYLVLTISDWQTFRLCFSKTPVLLSEHKLNIALSEGMQRTKNWSGWNIN